MAVVFQGTKIFLWNGIMHNSSRWRLASIVEEYSEKYACKIVTSDQENKAGHREGILKKLTY